jgi:hypothetical protein
LLPTPSTTPRPGGYARFWDGFWDERGREVQLGAEQRHPHFGLGSLCLDKADDDAFGNNGCGAALTIRFRIPRPA